MAKATNKTTTRRTTKTENREKEKIGSGIQAAREAAAKQGGNYMSLKDDGESMKVVFTGDVEVVKDTYRGNERVSYEFGIINADTGVVGKWSTGVSIFRAIDPKFDAWVENETPVTITRHGKKGSTETTYSIMEA